LEDRIKTLIDILYKEEKQEVLDAAEKQLRRTVVEMLLAEIEGMDNGSLMEPIEELGG
jgi:RNA polymerase-interacting CarD/CdnL/TRCF family regulator